MAALANVIIDSAPAHRPFMARWPQPYLPGDLNTTWYVKDAQQTTRKVQRDRLTDEVMMCSVLVDMGAVTGAQVNFTMETGPATTPATGWAIPVLTGLGMRWTAAHDGNSTHFADFLDTTTQTILRDGHVERCVRRYMLSKISALGTGNQAIGDGILCHHVYMHFRADLPDVIEISIRMSNAAAEVETDAASIAARGGGIKSAGPTQLNSTGYSKCELVMPAGWAFVSDRPSLADETTIAVPAGSITSNAHTFPRKLATRRDIVIYRTAASGAAAAAADLLALKGLGRATTNDGVEGEWRSYYTVRAWGPSKSILPRLDVGYSGGYAAASAQALSQFTGLKNASMAGTVTWGPSFGDGEFGIGFRVARRGIFQPIASNDPQETGGNDIGPFCGARRHVRDFVRFARLYVSHKMDSCGVYLYQRTTGKPLRTSDFALAYAGGPVAWHQGSPAFAGIRQPFSFYCQTNSGYEYIPTDQFFFAGWMQKDTSWPPHFYADGITYQSNNYWMQQRWWPKQTSEWGTPPRTLWSFVDNYRPTLEQVPYSTAPDAATYAGRPVFQQLRAYLASDPFGGTGGVPWKDPEDNQHAIRMFRHMVACVWLSGDLCAIDDIAMMAEWYALEYSEVGFLPSNQFDSFSSKLVFRSLKGRLESQLAAPNTAAYRMGRGDAWVGLLNATNFALQSVAEREVGYAQGYGIRKRAEMFYDFIRNGLITLNGMAARDQGAPSGGPNPYVELGLGDVPIPTHYQIMQAGLELPKLYHAYWALFKQLYSTLPAASIAQTQAQLMTGYTDWLARVEYYTSVSGRYFPHNYVATWDTTAPVGPVPGDLPAPRSPNANQEHWTDQQAILEIAFRISGDLGVFATANRLGPQSPVGTSPQERAIFLVNAESEYSPGLTGLMQYPPAGPDVVIDDPPPPPPDPTNPTISASMSPSPVTQGSTATIFALVTLGANPTSTGVTVIADLSGIGGSATAALLDDGVSPDVAAGDLTYSLNVATAGVRPLTHTIEVTVRDAQGREATTKLAFPVSPQPTSPLVHLTASPAGVVAGTVLTVYGDVVLGTNPTSTGVTVTADLSSLDGPKEHPLLDDGVSPDTAAGDNTFTANYTVPVDTPEAGYELTLTVTDAEGRSNRNRVSLEIKVHAPPPDPPPDPVSTNPTIIVQSGTRLPLIAGGTLTLFGRVTAGTNPAGEGHEVIVDLSELGGEEMVFMRDDGVAPDVAADDLIFSTSFVTSGALDRGLYGVGMVVSDKLGRTGTGKLEISIIGAPPPSTNPVLFASASLSPVVQLSTTTISALVVPGTSPTSTGITVTADLTAFGGGATDALLDDGVSPDQTAGDLIYSRNLTPSLSVPADGYEILVTMTDAQARTATSAFKLEVSALVIPPVVTPRSPRVALLVYDGDQRIIFPVALNLGQRLEVYDEDKNLYEILSSPDTAALRGGQLPITDVDGTTIILVPFFPSVVPIEIPDPPDPPLPPDVTVGTQAPGEIQEEGGPQSEQAGC